MAATSGWSPPSTLTCPSAHDITSVTHSDWILVNGCGVLLEPGHSGAHFMELHLGILLPQRQWKWQYPDVSWEQPRFT
jgi:hypothetical protein